MTRSHQDAPSQGSAPPRAASRADVSTLVKTRSDSPNASISTNGSQHVRASRSARAPALRSPASRRARQVESADAAYQAQSGSRREPSAGTTASTPGVPRRHSAVSSAGGTNGMSQATTMMLLPFAAARPAAMPPSGPVPGASSATTRSAGNHSRAAGSLATTIWEVVACRRADRARSAMRTPPMVASPLGKPPKRRAAPPARRTPMQVSLVPAELRAAARVVPRPTPAPA